MLLIQVLQGRQSLIASASLIFLKTYRYFYFSVDSAEEMKTFLCMQQKAMGFLIETANKDMATLKDIQEKLAQYVRE